MIKRNVLIIIFLLIAESVFAQSNDIRFYKIPVLENLDLEILEDMIQDNDGFIWFLTQNGLYKFDGYNLIAYKADPTKENTISDSNLLYGKPIIDSNGNIWILIRLTGLRLDFFDKKRDRFFQMDLSYIDRDSTNPLEIYDFLEDTQQNIWLGTNLGLFKCALIDLYEGLYTGTQPEFENFIYDTDDPFSLSNDSIYSLAKDALGNILVGTSAGLDLMIHEKELPDQETRTPNFRNIYPGSQDKTNQSNSSIIYGIEIDDFNNIWFFNEQDYLYKISKDEYAQFLEKGKQPFIRQVMHPVSNVSEAIFSKGKLWIASLDFENGGLFVANLDAEQNPGPFTKYNQENSQLYGNRTRNLLTDMAGNIWISGYPGGVDVICSNTDAFSYFSDEGYTFTFGIFEDHIGRVWLATSAHGGLYMIDRSKDEFRSFKNDPDDLNTISSNNIRIVFEDQDNILWIGTARDGLNVVDLNQPGDDFEFYRYLHDPDDTSSIFTNYFFGTFFQDANKELWIGGLGGGLARVIKPSGEISGHLSEYSFENHYLKPQDGSVQWKIWCVTSTAYFDSLDLLWIGTSQGLYLFNKKEKSSVHLPLPIDKFIGSSLDHVSCIEIENDHIIWLGTAGSGLIKLEILDPTDIKKTGDTEPDQYASFVLDEEQVYYTTEWFTERDGLVDNIISGVIEDANGNLWLSTNSGVCRFNTFSETFKYFSETKDVMGIYCGYHKARSGEIFFTGAKKNVYFYPENIRDNTYIPPVYITGFKLFNKPVEPDKDSPLKDAIEFTEKLDLSYKQNFLSFEFTALNYDNAQGKQYK